MQDVLNSVRENSGLDAVLTPRVSSQVRLAIESDDTPLNTSQHSPHFLTITLPRYGCRASLLLEQIKHNNRARAMPRNLGRTFRFRFTQGWGPRALVASPVSLEVDLEAVQLRFCQWETVLYSTLGKIRSPVSCPVWVWRARCGFTVGYISKKCHIPNFENQERASQILMIHHNLTKGAV